MHRNCIIYLLGFAGVGKRTIAKEITKQANFRLVDNHTINNVVFPFVRVNSHTKMPKEIWEKIGMIRNIAMETLIDIGNRDFNYIFTNQLFENNEDDLRIYKKIEETAEKIGAKFMPVRLLCDAEENRRRIVQPDRNEHMKLTSDAYIDELTDEIVFIPAHPSTFTIDVTSMSANEAAKQILTEFSRKFPN